MALFCSCSCDNSGSDAEGKIRAAATRKTLDSLGCDVVYVVLDAFHANHASLYGYRRQTTPFLDQLKGKSVVFENFFAHSPYTLASTATLLTSKYPFQHGLTSKERALAEDLPTLPRILADYNIDSHLVSDHPFICGEQWGLSRDYTEVNEFVGGSYKSRRTQVVDTLRAIYQRRRPARRQFVYMHLIPPHLSFVPPKDYMIFSTPYADSVADTRKFMQRVRAGEVTPGENELDYLESVYDANVLFADGLAEDVYEFFRDNGLLKTTVLIFSSDHGEACRMQHGELGHNTTIYDEMIHIPFIVVLPEMLGFGNKTIGDIHGVIDVAPTILDLFDVEAAPGFEGHSLLPWIVGGRPTREDSYVFLNNPLKKQLGIRDLRYKYVETPGHSMLFDLAADPGERHNLYEKEGSIARRYALLIREIYHPEQAAVREQRVDLRSLDEEQRRRLRALGYIK